MKVVVDKDELKGFIKGIIWTAYYQGQKCDNYSRDSLLNSIDSIPLTDINEEVKLKIE